MKRRKHSMYKYRAVLLDRQWDSINMTIPHRSTFNSTDLARPCLKTTNLRIGDHVRQLVKPLARRTYTSVYSLA